MDFLLREFPVGNILAAEVNAAGDSADSIGQKAHGEHFHTRTAGSVAMGKGNHSQKNDKKRMKPKQDKTKPAAKK